MTFILNRAIEIDAPAEIVWEVITDLPRYGEWNPFVRECESTLEVGAPIVMRVQIFSSFSQVQTEIVKAHEPGTHLCYGLAPQPLGALESLRGHDVTPLGDARCQYRSSFELRGWLSPLVQTLLGRRLDAGFASMTDAIGVRATELAAKRTGA